MMQVQNVLNVINACYKKSVRTNMRVVGIVNTVSVHSIKKADTLTLFVSVLIVIVGFTLL